MLPHFKRYERYEGGASEYHGASGEFGVSRAAQRPSLLRGVGRGRRAARPAAQSRTSTPPRTYGVGAYQLGIRNGWRSSAARAFLRPALRAPEPHACVTRRAGDAGAVRGHARAVGVEWLEATARSDSARARARGDPRGRRGAVAAAAAALGHRPGAAAARRTASACVADAPEVGENLQDHYQARTIVRLKERLSLNDDVRNPVQARRHGPALAVRRAGPLTVGAGQVGGAACSRMRSDGRARRAVQRDAALGRQAGRPAARYSGFTAAVWQCHPASRGSVAHPLGRSARAAAHRDRTTSRGASTASTLVAGIRMLREIYAPARVPRPVGRPRCCPGPQRPSDAALLDFARAHRRHGVPLRRHLPHGKRRARGGRSRSCACAASSGLRVIDASVMPTVTSANTNAAALMIGEKGAALLRS